MRGFKVYKTKLIARTFSFLPLVPCFGDDGDAFFIVTDYHAHGSLEDLLNSRGALHPVEATQFIVAVLDALDAVHARGLIHRDVKPANILLQDDGNLKSIPIPDDIRAALTLPGGLTSLESDDG